MRTALSGLGARRHGPFAFPACFPGHWRSGKVRNGRRARLGGRGRPDWRGDRRGRPERDRPGRRIVFPGGPDNAKEHKSDDTSASTCRIGWLLYGRCLGDISRGQRHRSHTRYRARFGTEGRGLPASALIEAAIHAQQRGPRHRGAASRARWDRTVASNDDNSCTVRTLLALTRRTVGKFEHLPAAAYNLDGHFHVSPCGRDTAGGDARATHRAGMITQFGGF